MASRFFLAGFLKLQSVLFRNKVKSDCCFAAVESTRRAIDEHYCNVLLSLRKQHEKNMRHTVAAIKREHQVEKQQMTAEFEEKLNELRKIIDEKDAIIKDSRKAYTYMAEVLPRMQELSEYNASLVEQETIRQIEKQRKYDRLKDECYAISRAMEKKTKYFSKFLETI